MEGGGSMSRNLSALCVEDQYFLLAFRALAAIWNKNTMKQQPKLNWVFPQVKVGATDEGNTIKCLTSAAHDPP